MIIAVMAHYSKCKNDKLSRKISLKKENVKRGLALSIVILIMTDIVKNAISKQGTKNAYSYSRHLWHIYGRYCFDC